MNEHKRLLSFIEGNLNNDNKLCNAIAYDGEIFSNAINVRVAFQRNHRMQYNSLLHFCADNNLTVVRTIPATLETVIRVSTEEK